MKRKVGRPPLPKRKISKIYVLRDMGMEMKSIADAMGISSGVVHKYLIKRETE